MKTTKFIFILLFLNLNSIFCGTIHHSWKYKNIEFILDKEIVESNLISELVTFNYKVAKELLDDNELFNLAKTLAKMNKKYNSIDFYTYSNIFENENIKKNKEFYNIILQILNNETFIKVYNKKFTYYEIKFHNIKRLILYYLDYYEQWINLGNTKIKIFFTGYCKIIEGLYYTNSNTIYCSLDSTYEQVVITILHELTHHYSYDFLNYFYRNYTNLYLSMSNKLTINGVDIDTINETLTDAFLYSILDENINNSNYHKLPLIYDVNKIFNDNEDYLDIFNNRKLWNKFIKELSKLRR